MRNFGSRELESGIIFLLTDTCVHVIELVSYRTATLERSKGILASSTHAEGGKLFALIEVIHDKLSKVFRGYNPSASCKM